ncbi:MULTISPECIES: class I SAM-dependent methyltransferase [unclassified Nitratiruptor]|uniref:class I SAM-dependent DNA methyltransferase n=1 Tax=unclassified Nitratiruptor TaxID=2624044 RepID=UPI0019155F4F|nr:MULTISPECIES: class I SAM-dependent methyltransferase [unclassified Nitratiruptor]BCD60110.1 hypothetical protein NitYY0810_C0875 [Nitratiruptor sp. YY08-10]BCD64401.1 hypothetical protein NitYY0814_C1246 [Nitratiruptor sp. YY08-14]
MGLELYAKIEPFLGFEQEKQKLYQIYIDKLQSLGIKNFLDLGCGSGTFMQLALDKGLEPFGIDLSTEMVRRCQNKGLKAKAIDICDMQERFEAVTAVFDVLNYIEPKHLERFFDCIAKRLPIGGYFLCDINTLFGFEEIAQGSLILDQETVCIGIDAEFDREKLMTKFILFEQKDNCFTKSVDNIVQYYHDVADLKKFALQLVDIDLISLYADQSDKALLTFQKGR